METRLRSTVLGFLVLFLGLTALVLARSEPGAFVVACTLTVFFALGALAARRPGPHLFDVLVRNPAVAPLVSLAFAVPAIGLTGGVASPFGALLFVPILAAAFSYGIIGSAAMACLVILTLPLLAAAQGTPEPLGADVLSRVFDILLVTGAMGLLADTLRSTVTAESGRARSEEERARVVEQRAQETEAFLDTSVMMGSFPDLDNTLDVALIRLAELVSYDVCAVFLRQHDSEHLAIERLTGISPDAVQVRNLPLRESEEEWGRTVEARHWPDVQRDSAGLRTLANLDPAARSVIVAPLRTIDDFFGLLYVSRRDGARLTERDCRIINQFAQFVVFPIQRVRLQALATTDAMTGLDNYRSFRLRLADEVRRSLRYGHSLSLILLDIDHFKRINDTHLHVAGDSILKQMAGILRSSLRGFDIPARYGGEEMVIICPEIDIEDAVKLAERIRATVEEYPFSLPEGGSIPVTISLGVATLGRDAATDEGLVEMADKALYRAKTSGRNTVRAAGDTSLDVAAVNGR